MGSTSVFLRLLIPAWTGAFRSQCRKNSVDAACPRFWLLRAVDREDVAASASVGQTVVGGPGRRIGV